MAIDASNHVILYSKVQDPSTATERAECNYFTIVLAVIGAIKEFYPYLYGFQFKLLTDHNVLTSLKGLKDTGGHLA